MTDLHAPLTAEAFPLELRRRYNTDHLLTIHEAAQTLGTQPSTIRMLIRYVELGHWVGGVPRFSKSDVAWMRRFFARLAA